MAELRRVLNSGGRLGLAVWGRIDLSPPFAAVGDALAEILGPEAAVRYRAGPWGLHPPARLAQLVEGAGFEAITVEEIRRPVRFEGGAGQLQRSLAATAVAEDLAALPPGRLQQLSRAIQNHLAGITDTHGAVSSHLTSQILLAVAAPGPGGTAPVA